MGCHIVRIDKPKNTTTGTHGWQVRVGGKRGYHSKLFSDSKHGTRGKALVAAESYLEKYLDEHPEFRVDPDIPRFRSSDRPPIARNTSGYTGVYRSYGFAAWDKKKEHKVEYWVAFCPIGPEGQRNRWMKRYYVDSLGDDVARQKAIDFRRGWEEAAAQGKEALEKFFKEEHYAKLKDTRFGAGMHSYYD